VSPSHRLPLLPVPRTAPARTPLGRWAERGERLDEHGGPAARHPWQKVLFLSGVDYFSTLAYQPGIALLAAGALSPVASAILVLVTLLCALPVYSQVAWRSFAGQGSIAMIENQLSGWSAKLAVLVLLGFAATDFVITITLSAADAAQHAVENPLLRAALGGSSMAVTLVLLALLAGVFLRGFREAIGVATLIALPYLAMTVAVLVRALVEVMAHPALLASWRGALAARGDPSTLLIGAAVVFPRLALGLSGFETGVAVMPLVAGDAREDGRPVEQIRNTRRLLMTAAMVMSLLLLASSLATTILVPEEAYRRGGEASGRALSWLAHRHLGHLFGSSYDFLTILMLWFAGASALAGLLNLVPRYLPRFGMAPRWTVYSRPLVLAFLAITTAVTILFGADVEAQAGAYATGVLAIMLSAAVAVTLAYAAEARQGTAPWRRKARLSMAYFGVVSVVFGFTFVDNILGRADGLIIAGAFIVTIVLLSAASRYRRATELRVSGVELVDDESKALWDGLAGRKASLVPLKTASADHRRAKAAEIRQHYRVPGRLAFIHVALADNRSEFLASLRVKVRNDGEDIVIEVHGAVAVANTLAYVSELIDPAAIFLGLTRRNLMTQALRFLFWGEGETGLLVYSILLRYWEWTPDGDVRPRIYLMSD